jgi:hypothetical protein
MTYKPNKAESFLLARIQQLYRAKQSSLKRNGKNGRLVKIDLSLLIDSQGNCNLLVDGGDCGELLGVINE